MAHQTFDSKWKEAAVTTHREESNLFVPQGEQPRTQRQFNLYNYYEFIRNHTRGKQYHDAIELGCGRGTLALYLADYEGMRVICNDSEESAIALARRNFAHANREATFLVGDAANTGLPDESVDVCVSIGLLEHIPNYVPILKEQYRILRKGGVMISLNIPKKRSVQILNNIYRSIYRIFSPSFPFKSDYFRTSDTPEMYMKAAENAGFRDVSTINVNPFPIFTPLHPTVERSVTYLYRAILALRRIFLSYPFKTSYPFAQAHFLVGYKRST